MADDRRKKLMMKRDNFMTSDGVLLLFTNFHALPLDSSTDKNIEYEAPSGVQTYRFSQRCLEWSFLSYVISSSLFCLAAANFVWCVLINVTTSLFVLWQTL